MMRSRQNIIVVIEEGEEETKCDHVSVGIDAEESVSKKDEHSECMQKFCNVSDEEIMSAMSLTLKDPANEIAWDILSDGEHSEWDEIK